MKNVLFLALFFVVLALARRPGIAVKIEGSFNHWNVGEAR